VNLANGFVQPYESAGGDSDRAGDSDRTEPLIDFGEPPKPDVVDDLLGFGLPVPVNSAPMDMFMMPAHMGGAPGYGPNHMNGGFGPMMPAARPPPPMPTGARAVFLGLPPPQGGAGVGSGRIHSRA
jgi:hypothetical protein